MPRLTISLPQKLHNHLSSIAVQNNESLSSIINRLIQIGMSNNTPAEQKAPPNAIEEHCYKTILQVSVLVKYLSVELLEFNRDKFEQIRAVADERYHEILKKDNDT